MQRRFFIVRSQIQAIFACAAASELNDCETNDTLFLLDCMEPSAKRDLFEQMLRNLYNGWSRVEWIDKSTVNKIGKWRICRWQNSASLMQKKIRERVAGKVDAVMFQDSRSTVSKTVQLAFKGSRLISLGDGAGFELTDLWLKVLDLFSSSPLQKPPLRKKVKSRIVNWRKCPPLRPADQNYLIASRSGPTASLEHVRDVLSKASSFMDEHWGDLLVDLEKNIAKSARARLILTTPLSEEGGMTQQEEIAAYQAVLESHGDASGLILLKHHPRENGSKKALLHKALKESGATVIILDDALYGFPIELFLPSLLRLCHQHSCALSCQAFGTLAITIETLFDCPVSIGFGDEIVERYLGPESARRWNEMRDALQALRSEFHLTSPIDP